MPSTFPSRLFFALAALSACGNNQPPTLVEPDAPPDPPDPENIVFVETFDDSPVFIRYRTGNGEWQEPVDTGDGYELRVGDDYELVAVCASDGGVDVGFEIGTVEETDRTYLPCFTPYESEPTIAVTGTMAQPGIVVMGDSATGTTPNWSFELAVTPGTHDLIAADATHVAIRRDVETLDPIALPAIDTATEGVPFVTKTFTSNAIASEVIRTQVLWFTSGGGAFLDSGPGSTAKLPPTSLLAGTDTMYSVLGAADLGTFRTVYVREIDNADAEVEFLPQLDNVTFTDDGAAWTGPLGFGADLYTVQDATAVHIAASPGWIATHSKLAIDTDIPGFRPEWRVTSPRYRGFSISDTTPFTFRYSTKDDLSSAR